MGVYVFADRVSACRIEQPDTCGGSSFPVLPQIPFGNCVLPVTLNVRTDAFFIVALNVFPVSTSPIPNFWGVTAKRAWQNKTLDINAHLCGIFW